jgi:hypothetical protein
VCIVAKLGVPCHAIQNPEAGYSYNWICLGFSSLLILLFHIKPAFAPFQKCNLNTTTACEIMSKMA